MASNKWGLLFSKAAPGCCYSHKLSAYMNSLREQEEHMPCPHFGTPAEALLPLHIYLPCHLSSSSSHFQSKNLLEVDIFPPEPANCLATKQYSVNKSTIICCCYYYCHHFYYYFAPVSTLPGYDSIRAYDRWIKYEGIFSNQKVTMTLNIPDQWEETKQNGRNMAK